MIHIRVQAVFHFTGLSACPLLSCSPYHHHPSVQIELDYDGAVAFSSVPWKDEFSEGTYEGGGIGEGRVGITVCNN